VKKNDAVVWFSCEIDCQITAQELTDLNKGE